MPLLGNPFLFFVLVLAGWLGRGQADVIEYLREENRVLRSRLGPGRPTFSDGERRRLARAAHALPRRMLHELETIVTPDTLRRWYRRLVAAKYDGSPHRRGGRPGTRSTVEQLVVRFALENRTWGYTRIRGALLNLGHDLSTSTIARILKRHGVSPAPVRASGTTWKEFLRMHWDALAATDFFTVEVLTVHGLVRYAVLFVIELRTRRVEVLGIAHEPGGEWVANVARGAIDGVDGCLLGIRYLIHDRDPVFTQEFREILEQGGVRCVRLPARSPNLNAFAERFVGSIRRECLDRVIPLGERHRRHLVREYVRHYNTERNHQGIGNRLVEPAPCAANGDGPIECRERLGGLLRYYHREAA